MSVTPARTHRNTIRSREYTQMDFAIEAALLRLKGAIHGLKAEEIQNADGQPDRDHNYKLVIEIKPGETEKASIFALNLNGQPKEFETIVTQLVEKIQQHLINRERADLIKFASGAMMDPHGVPIGIKDGYLAVNGKIVVCKEENNKYELFESTWVGTYSLIHAFQEESLVITKDDHEAIRDDGKEGFIVNVDKPLRLKKEQLLFKEANSSLIPEEGEYLLLYRTREEARNA